MNNGRFTALYAPYHIRAATELLVDICINYTFVLVAIDSSRNQALKGLVSLMLKNDISGTWLPGGFVVEGASFHKLLESEILVPFSAFYMFPDTLRINTVPAYNFTSESGEFNGNVPQELLSALQKSGAVAYVADGAGLNVVSSDPIITAVISPLFK